MSEDKKSTTKQSNSNDSTPSLGGRGTSTVKRDYSSNTDKSTRNTPPPRKTK